MNLPFFIAKRYFKSKKQKNFISIISNISMIGVAIGTMALVVVLSVYNGLGSLIRSFYNSFDPQLLVEAKKGKTFEVDSSFIAEIKSVPGIASVSEVIEDNAYARYKKAEMVVKVKGVSPEYKEQSGIGEQINLGTFKYREKQRNYALIGAEVQYALSVNVNNDFYPLQIYYPKRKAKASLDPRKMFNNKSILPSGVFTVDRKLDYIIVPLSFAQGLTGYGNERTSLEIMLESDARVSKVQNELKKLLGDKFEVLNRDEQQATLLKVLRIERLFLIVALSFIIAVASFNIFFSLSMLAIEKKKDISVMYAMGASDHLIRRIFLNEGLIIAITGALLGVFTGLGICLLQAEFGLVKMGFQGNVLIPYPVKIIWTDLLVTGAVVIVITLLASLRPAQIASRYNNNSML
ncbi:FtsX-like permease family protein [Aureibacter tunicatorum]|uniref:Lipoprotein-releasing system permease protein n=1 Tax=Aureibacter tunicatorum TaxID=866807 RepID=A0AAE4BQJ8_9BACT|nr:FtsX-like permease family protein [Aureibacter tunicatorum]MDR6237641.1 lipoprotein-releasing system permease protein [Aureibacter tunicatorum]BDD02676.1 membrane protein [Aureibacter tunicatorum]